MELLKKQIPMNQSRDKIVSQTTVDEDINVPDTHRDIDEILLKKGRVIIDDIRREDDGITIKGNLLFELLYNCPEEQGSAYLEGSIPVTESIRINEMSPRDDVDVSALLEDFSVNVIHSRKIRIGAVITWEAWDEHWHDEELAVSVQGEDDARIKKEECEVLQCRFHGKDTLRIKEETQLPGTKPNIGKLLWKDVKIQRLDTRGENGQLLTEGELSVFVVYTGEEEHVPMQCMEYIIPFSGRIECAKCQENMIVFVKGSLHHYEIDVKEDMDGEHRILASEAVIDLNISLYEEEPLEFLVDVYSPKKQVNASHKDVELKELVVRNAVKCKVLEKFRIPQEEGILQICHSSGEVKVDRGEVVENGVLVEGAVEVSILYLTSDDRVLIAGYTGAVPFSCMVEAEHLESHCHYQLIPSLEQIGTMMLGNGEIEVRGVIRLDTLIWKPVVKKPVDAIQVRQYSKKELEEMPGIIGYVVKEGDTLWDVAKLFQTTEEVVRKTNHFTGDELTAGNRLIFVKSADTI